MENSLLYLFIYLVEGGILWQYCHTLFPPKHRLSLRTATLLLLYTALAFLFSLHLMQLNILFFLIANFLFLISMFRISCLSALFHASLTTAIMALSELAVLTVVPNIAYNFNQSFDYQKRLLFLTIFSKLLYFMIVFVLSHALSKQKESAGMKRKEICLLLIVPLLTVWIVITFFYICYQYMLPEETYTMVLISSLFLLIINVVTWMIYGFLLHQNQQFTVGLLQHQKESFLAEHYQILLRQNEEQRLLIHDMKSHLQSISLLNEQRETDKAGEYIRQLLSSAPLKSSTHYCDHQLLNAILCFYDKKCFDQGVSFHADIRHHAADFLSEKNLTSLFCNLLENAVEAAKDCEKGFIDLSLSDQDKTDFIVLKVTNSCLSDPFRNNAELHTTKRDTVKHGYGLKSIQKVVDTYHGDMQMYYESTDCTMHTNIIFRAQERK